MKKAFPIIVVEAVNLIKAGYTVTDVNGRELTKKRQRTISLSLTVNIEAQHSLNSIVKVIHWTIPNVYIKDIKNVGNIW